MMVRAATAAVLRRLRVSDHAAAAAAVSREVKAFDAVRFCLHEGTLDAYEIERMAHAGPPDPTSRVAAARTPTMPCPGCRAVSARED